ncbi:uncharacterized protein LOC590715 [Strongylocentrotus purpuratus]|uniref:C2H2-type domain-containing protein n=1 Tax=Strongylocentrotus purpuratus TaxID=7668 RepID=A0A7M7THB3_STRPU|nr:uncharacterized protein LOC590715 [Strongylocentrotus purpuratus]
MEQANEVLQVVSTEPGRGGEESKWDGENRDEQCETTIQQCPLERSENKGSGDPVRIHFSQGSTGDLPNEDIPGNFVVDVDVVGTGVKEKLVDLKDHTSLEPGGVIPDASAAVITAEADDCKTHPEGDTPPISTAEEKMTSEETETPNPGKVSTELGGSDIMSPIEAVVPLEKVKGDSIPLSSEDQESEISVQESMKPVEECRESATQKEDNVKIDLQLGAALVTHSIVQDVQIAKKVENEPCRESPGVVQVIGTIETEGDGVMNDGQRVKLPETVPSSSQEAGTFSGSHVVPTFEESVPVVDMLMKTSDVVKISDDSVTRVNPSLFMDSVTLREKQFAEESDKENAVCIQVEKDITENVCSTENMLAVAMPSAEEAGSDMTEKPVEDTITSTVEEVKQHEVEHSHTDLSQILAVDTGVVVDTARNVLEKVSSESVTSTSTGIECKSNASDETAMEISMETDQMSECAPMDISDKSDDDIGQMPVESPTCEMKPNQSSTELTKSAIHQVPKSICPLIEESMDVTEEPMDLSESTDQISSSEMSPEETRALSKVYCIASQVLDKDSEVLVSHHPSSVTSSNIGKAQESNTSIEKVSTPMEESRENPEEIEQKGVAMAAEIQQLPVESTGEVTSDVQTNCDEKRITLQVSDMEIDHPIQTEDGRPGSKKPSQEHQASSSVLTASKSDFESLANEEQSSEVHEVDQSSKQGQEQNVDPVRATSDTVEQHSHDGQEKDMSLLESSSAEVKTPSCDTTSVELVSTLENEQPLQKDLIEASQNQECQSSNTDLERDIPKTVDENEPVDQTSVNPAIKPSAFSTGQTEPSHPQYTSDLEDTGTVLESSADNNNLLEEAKPSSTCNSENMNNESTSMELEHLQDGGQLRVEDGRRLADEYVVVDNVGSSSMMDENEMDVHADGMQKERVIDISDGEETAGCSQNTDHVSSNGSANAENSEVQGTEYNVIQNSTADVNELDEEQIMPQSIVDKGEKLSEGIEKEVSRSEESITPAHEEITSGTSPTSDESPMDGDTGVKVSSSSEANTVLKGICSEKNLLNEVEEEENCAVADTPVTSESIQENITSKGSCTLTVIEEDCSEKLLGSNKASTSQQETVKESITEESDTSPSRKNIPADDSCESSKEVLVESSSKEISESSTQRETERPENTLFETECDSSKTTDESDDRLSTEHLQETVTVGRPRAHSSNVIVQDDEYMDMGRNMEATGATDNDHKCSVGIESVSNIPEETKDKEPSHISSAEGFDPGTDLEEITEEAEAKTRGESESQSSDNALGGTEYGSSVVSSVKVDDSRSDTAVKEDPLVSTSDIGMEISGTDAVVTPHSKVGDIICLQSEVNQTSTNMSKKSANEEISAEQSLSLGPSDIEADTEKVVKGKEDIHDVSQERNTETTAAAEFASQAIDEVPDKTKEESSEEMPSGVAMSSVPQNVDPAIEASDIETEKIDDINEDRAVDVTPVVADLTSQAVTSIPDETREKSSEQISNIEPRDVCLDVGAPDLDLEYSDEAMEVDEEHETKPSTEETKAEASVSDSSVLVAAQASSEVQRHTECTEEEESLLGEKLRDSGSGGAPEVVGSASESKDVSTTNVNEEPIKESLVVGSPDNSVNESAIMSDEHADRRDTMTAERVFDKNSEATEAFDQGLAREDLVEEDLPKDSENVENIQVDENDVSVKSQEGVTNIKVTIEEASLHQQSKELQPFPETVVQLEDSQPMTTENEMPSVPAEQPDKSVDSQSSVTDTASNETEEEQKVDQVNTEKKDSEQNEREDNAVPIEDRVQTVCKEMEEVSKIISENSDHLAEKIDQEDIEIPVLERSQCEGDFQAQGSNTVDNESETSAQMDAPVLTMATSQGVELDGSTLTDDDTKQLDDASSSNENEPGNASPERKDDSLQDEGETSAQMEAPVLTLATSQGVEFDRSILTDDDTKQLDNASSSNENEPGNASQERKVGSLQDEAVDIPQATKQADSNDAKGEDALSDQEDGTLMIDEDSPEDNDIIIFYDSKACKYNKDVTVHEESAPEAVSSDVSVKAGHSAIMESTNVPTQKPGDAKETEIPVQSSPVQSLPVQEKDPQQNLAQLAVTAQPADEATANMILQEILKMSETIGDGVVTIPVTTPEGEILKVPLTVEQTGISSSVDEGEKARDAEAQVVSDDKQKMASEVARTPEVNGDEGQTEDTSGHHLQSQDNFDEAEVIALESEGNETTPTSEARKAKKRIFSKTCRTGKCSCKHCLEAKRAKQAPAETTPDEISKAKRKPMPTNKFKKLAITFAPTVKKVKCSSCILVFETDQDMQAHFESTHVNQPKLCSICRQSFQNEELMKLHELSHEKSGMFLCLVCDKSYKRKADIVRHYKSHRNQAPSPVKRKMSSEIVVVDDQVDSKPSQPVKVRKLTAAFTGGVEKVKCTEKEAEMKAHLNSVHSKGPSQGPSKAPTKAPMLCSICQQSFQTEEDVKKHESSHEKNGRFVCLVCDKTYKRRADIVNHYHTHKPQVKVESSSSSQEKPKSSTTPAGGPSKNKQQTPDKPKTELFSCKLCGKDFVHEELLEEHKKIHTGAFPFPCSMCEKAFKQANQLKKHERVHTGDKPYMCQYCNKRFYSSSNKRRHERTHTGYKPYVCRICDKPLSEKWILKKHEKMHLSIGGISFDD